MIEVNNIIRQPSVGGFAGVGVRKGVKVVKSGEDWLGYNEKTIFADIRGWSEWGRQSQAARPDGEWQTLQEETTVVEYDRGQTHTSRLPAGTKYCLAKGGDAYTAALCWVVRPDRKYGPKVVR